MGSENKCYMQLLGAISKRSECIWFLSLFFLLAAITDMLTGTEKPLKIQVLSMIKEKVDKNIHLIMVQIIPVLECQGGPLCEREINFNLD